jgi:WD40 repeat protein
MLNNEVKVTKIAQLTGHSGAIFAVTDGTSRENREGVDAQHILSGAGDGWVVEWDLAQPELGRLVAKVERNIFSLLFLKNQNKLIAGDMDGGVRFVDLTEPSLTRNVLHHGGKGCFDVKMIDNQLFTIGGDGVLTRWSVAESRSVESIQLSHKSLRCFDFSKSRNELAIGGSDGCVYFVDATTLELNHVWHAVHSNSIFSICYTPDDAHLLTGGRDAHLTLSILPDYTEGGEGISKLEDSKISKLDSSEILKSSNFGILESIPAHLFTINSIVFHPTNPSIFATASRDRTIKIWQISAQNPKLTLLKVIDTIRHGCHIRSVNRLFWSKYNDYLISASDDRSLIVWRVDC